MTLGANFNISNPTAEQFKDAYTTIDELVADGLVTPDEALKLRALGAAYKVRIPRYYASLFDNSPEGRDCCPIRRQALPDLGESDVDGYLWPQWARDWSNRAFGRPTPWTADPIGDITNLAAPRLTHRYRNRAILHVSSLCALYCRFCFRKSHLNDADRKLYEGSLEPAMAYLRDHNEIHEVILTGGDPLSLPNAAIEKVLRKLRDIAHLRQIRIHTRMPVTMPSRITTELATLLGAYNSVVVTHFNHPKELTASAREALRILRRSGVPVFNQGVLLRKVNDSAEILAELFTELYFEGVRPYYLHHADWTRGTFHFRTSIAQGRTLMHALQGVVPGPAIPRYILDTPGGLGKVDLMTDTVQLEESRVEQVGGIILGGALHTIQTQTFLAKYAEFYHA